MCEESLSFMICIATDFIRSTPHPIWDFLHKWKTDGEVRMEICIPIAKATKPNTRLAMRNPRHSERVKAVMVSVLSLSFPLCLLF